MGDVVPLRALHESLPSPTTPGAPQHIRVDLDAASLNPEWSLSVALGSIARRKYAKMLFFSWPNLHEASLRLAGFLTNHFPGNGRSLLEESLATAMDRYDEAANDAKFELAPVRAFLLGLLECAPQVLDFHVYGVGQDEKTTRWEPFHTPISQWARKNKVKRLLFEPAGPDPQRPAPEFVRDVLAGQVLDWRNCVVVKGDIATKSEFDHTPPGA